MSAVATAEVRRLARGEVRRWLGQLDAWLLPGCSYGAQHTWPQLYRSDGDGVSFGGFVADELVSHCAFRWTQLRVADGLRRVALLGSVATAPEWRGQGLAGRVLATALAAVRSHADHVLLWAERPDLYMAHGFHPGGVDTALLLARRPRPDLGGVRLAQVGDHATLHRLHTAKPWGVVRSPGAMSALLSTPGMVTVVRERAGAVVAYACCGKGADLGGHWHEVGGDDAELAALLPAALHVAEQREAVLLLPPYRPALPALLGASVVDAITVDGPMVASFGPPLGPCWVDGLDSV
jgi:GNAT superfamily N-acetyltransferase